MNWLNPLWLLATIACLVFFLMLKLKSSSDDWHKVLHADVLHFLRGDEHSQRKRLPALLLAAIVAAALASPATRTSNSHAYTQSQGWIVIADISRSMTLSDVSPTRVSAMRDIAAELAGFARSRPIALIVFAGDAFLVTPPAIDKAHYLSNVQLLEHGLVPVEGSNLTRAISLATSVIEGSNMIDSRVILLSDTGGINIKTRNAVSHLSAAGHATDVIVIGNDGTSSNAGFDLVAARKLAEAGQGHFVQVDALGQLDLSNLYEQRLAFSSNTLVQSGLSLLHWANQSHWLLLLCIPIMLWMFQRERVR